MAGTVTLFQVHSACAPQFLYYNLISFTAAYGPFCTTLAQLAIVPVTTTESATPQLVPGWAELTITPYVNFATNRLGNNKPVGARLYLSCPWNTTFIHCALPTAC